MVFGYERLNIIDFTDQRGEKYEIIEKFSIFQKGDDGADLIKKQYRIILDV